MRYWPDGDIATPSQLGAPYVVPRLIQVSPASVDISILDRNTTWYCPDADIAAATKVEVPRAATLVHEVPKVELVYSIVLCPPIVWYWPVADMARACHDPVGEPDGRAQVIP